MWRSVLWTLRQRRYAALAAGMLVIALGCIAMGTFELHRYHEKRHDNGVLVGNAHAAAVPLSRLRVPVTGQGSVPASLAIKFRTVSVTGHYVVSGQSYLDGQSQDGADGFDVVTPLRTSAGLLLVTRGFVAATSSGDVPAHVPAPPATAVRVVGWLQPSETFSDGPSGSAHDVISAMNSARQASRLGEPVYQGFVTLRAHQPGAAGLHALAGPDLSNPSGGASDWQLLSYVVQWYVFAALALIAPFFFSRAEAKAAQRRFLGIDPGAAELDDVAAVEESTQLALPGTRARGSLVRRASGTVAKPAGVSSPAWQRAERLADRYGVSLGPLTEAEVAARAQRIPVDDLALGRNGRDGDQAPYRSPDAFHAAYNDYLWELSLADGGLSEPAPAAPPDDAPRREPRVIDMEEPEET